MSPGRRVPGERRRVPLLVSEMPLEDLLAAYELGYVPTGSRLYDLCRKLLPRRARAAEPRPDQTPAAAPRPTVVYAPATLRVPRPPWPGDERFLDPAPDAVR